MGYCKLNQVFELSPLTFLSTHPLLILHSELTQTRHYSDAPRAHSICLQIIGAKKASYSFILNQYIKCVSIHCPKCPFRDHQQITFVMLNRYCPLRKPPLTLWNTSQISFFNRFTPTPPHPPIPHFLNRQNPLSVTKMFCWCSLLTSKRHLMLDKSDKNCQFFKNDWLLDNLKVLPDISKL